MKIIKSLLFLIFAVGLTQCNNDCGCEEATEYGTVRFEWQIVQNGNQVALKDIISFAGMNEFMLEKLKFHIDHLEGMNSSGDFYEISEVDIIDFENEMLTSFDYQLKTGTYQKLVFGAGLDEAHNASDPSDFDMDHPLSSAQGMFWTWASKYRFTILEGRANEMGTIGMPTDIIMAYHPGADDFYKTYEQGIDFTINEGQTKELIATVDLDIIFNTGSAGKIDIPTENQTHTTPDDWDLAEKFQTNFGEAISFKVK